VGLIGDIKAARTKRIMYQCLPHIHIFTESDKSSYTVGDEHGAYFIYTIFGALYIAFIAHTQIEREIWYMIDLLSLQRCPIPGALVEIFNVTINKWGEDINVLFLGRELPAISHEYYDLKNTLRVFLQNYREMNLLYVGFFHTGAYQDQISGYGGIKHCLIYLHLSM
jgi:arginine decarboxylase